MIGWRLHVAAATAATVLGLSGWALIDALSPINPNPPVRFSHVEVLTPVVTLGDPVKVRIWREKDREDCGRVVSNRRALDIDADPPVDHVRAPVEWEGGPANTHHLDYGYDTRGLYASRWLYVVALTYYCEDGAVFTIQQPSFFFTIREG